MVTLAKAALGISSTLVLAGVYTLHEGVIRVDVDEYRSGGSHVHFWAPAIVVPMVMHFVPRADMCEASAHARGFLPTAHAFMKELKKFPDADLIEVTGREQHVRIRTCHGKLQVDIQDPGETVHLLCPLSTLDEVTSQLESNTPAS